MITQAYGCMRCSTVTYYYCPPPHKMHRSYFGLSLTKSVGPPTGPKIGQRLAMAATGWEMSGRSQANGVWSTNVLFDFCRLIRRPDQITAASALLSFSEWRRCTPSQWPSLQRCRETNDFHIKHSTANLTDRVIAYRRLICPSATLFIKHR